MRTVDLPPDPCRYDAARLAPARDQDLLAAELQAVADGIGWLLDRTVELAVGRAIESAIRRGRRARLPNSRAIIERDILPAHAYRTELRETLTGLMAQLPREVRDLLGADEEAEEALLASVCGAARPGSLTAGVRRRGNRLMRLNRLDLARYGKIHRQEPGLRPGATGDIRFPSRLRPQRGRQVDAVFRLSRPSLRHRDAERLRLPASLSDDAGRRRPRRSARNAARWRG